MSAAPQLYSKTYAYIQDKDTWDPGQEDQRLDIETHRVDDGPNGSYITISTDRWAIDFNEIDAFCALLKKSLEDL